MGVDVAYVDQMNTIAAENRAIQQEIYTANEIKAFESGQTMRTKEFESDLISERLVLANDLASELATAGKFDEVTVKLMLESLVRQGLLPADTPALTVTKLDGGGIVIVNPQTGDVVTQYVPDPNQGGGLVELRPNPRGGGSLVE
jgi:hypothetical protein